MQSYIFLSFMVYPSSSLSHDLTINQCHICDMRVWSKSEILYANYSEIDF
jgi:hypothetical protein